MGGLRVWRRWGWHGREGGPGCKRGGLATGVEGETQDGDGGRDKEATKSLRLWEPFYFPLIICLPQLILFIYFFLFLFGAAPAAYGNSQARGRIGATAAGLHPSYSNARSLTH